MPVKPGAKAVIEARIGRGNPLRDATLQDVVAKVPKSRLPPHPLVETDAELRVRHARGQSLPDWLAMRSGDFAPFPDGVARPTSTEEVRTLLAYAKANDVVVIPYGGGTSVAGHINPEKSQKPVLTLSLARMNRLLDLDRQSQIATFGAGTRGPDVELQLAPHGYTLGHFPQSFELSTVGGWVASRSSGQQSLRYGRIEQMFAGGTMETPVGTLDLPTFPASSAGPDLREVVLGSEGRMGVLTEVKVRVTRKPERETFRVFFLPSWRAGVEAVRESVQRKLPLSMVRLSNAEETRTQLVLAGNEIAIAALDTYLAIRGASEGRCMLTFGCTGSRSQVKFQLAEMSALLAQYGGVDTADILGKRWEHARFRSPYLRHGLWGLGYAVDTFETATDWVNVHGLVDAAEDAVKRALEEEGERVLVFTHLSHVYQQGSSAYTTYVFRCASSYEATLERWKRIKRAASEAIVKNKGTISHQHGVGVDHAPYLAHEKGELGMKTLASLAAHFDPEGRMNPGKLLREGA